MDNKNHNNLNRKEGGAFFSPAYDLTSRIAGIKKPEEPLILQESYKV